MAPPPGLLLLLVDPRAPLVHESSLRTRCAGSWWMWTSSTPQRTLLRWSTRQGVRPLDLRSCGQRGRDGLEPVQARVLWGVHVLVRVLWGVSVLVRVLWGVSVLVRVLWGVHVLVRVLWGVSASGGL